MQFLKVQSVSLLLGATGKAEIKIESEDTFLNLSYFYNLTQLHQSAVIMQGESLKKEKACSGKASSILNNYLYYNISKEKRREQD